MPSLATSLRQELTRLLEPLTTAAGSADRWALVLALVGHPAAAASDPGLKAALDSVGQLAKLGDVDLESFAGIEALLGKSAQAITALRQLENAASTPALKQQLAQLGPDLAQQLTAIYLRRYRARVFRAAALLTLIEPEQSRPAILSGATRTRAAWTSDVLHADRLGHLLDDPWGTLRAVYLPNDLATAADAHAAADRLFGPLEALLAQLRLPVSSERHSLLPDIALTDLDGDHFDDPPLPPQAPVAPSGDLSAYYQTTLPQLSLRLFDAALALTASSPEHPSHLQGFVFELIGALNKTVTSGPWTIAATSQGTIPAFVAGPDGFKLATQSAAAATAKITAARQETFLLGSATGTRIELEALTAALELAIATSTPSAALSAAATHGKLVIAPGDGDGLIQHVLPPQGITVNFDAGVSLSSARGFELEGGTGLKATLPANVPLGPLGRINSVALALDGSTASASAALTVHLGPVDIDVDGVGLTAGFSSAPGNLAIASAELGFKGPDKLGLSIAAGPVTGGGFLAHDPTTGEYSGEIHLTFEGIGARAVGIITTRPDFSLLVLVAAEFPPMQLGMGFMLVGAGGLLGINRTVAVEALRSGLKTGALGAVLAPPGAGEGAAQTVAALAALFPPAAGRHVFAPTARIVWGSPALITIDLALALELPSPVRLVALGRLKAILPSASDPIVKLQVDALGVIDFDRKEASVDATLSDSRIAEFALSGDMALRMSWGENPTFLLAVGGFHPRFSAPPGFPALERISIALASGDNPKLRLEAYLALTSNTVQFGARVDLAAKAGSFSIAGFLSFDALVTLAPLAFVVDIAARLAVKAGGHTLFSVSLALTLSGPRPWHARGKASFSILFFDISFSFDVTIGDAAQPALPAPVDVAPLILQALCDPRAWETQLAGPAVVSLRTLEPGPSILAHPLATLKVRQRVAPLDRTLDRFGTSVPSGAKAFKITLATIGGVRASLTPLQDRFAPAQFTNMSDDAKLSAPSFQDMTSGAALGADGFSAGVAVTVTVLYEQRVVAAATVATPAPQKLALPDDVFASLTKTTPEPDPEFAIR